jgi:hypothetical protein
MNRRSGVARDRFARFYSWTLPFHFRRSILRAAFFCCFFFRNKAFCRFLNVSICPPLSLVKAERAVPVSCVCARSGDSSESAGVTARGNPPTKDARKLAEPGIKPAEKL